MIKESKAPKNSGKKDEKKGEDKNKNKFSLNSFTHRLKELAPDMDLEKDHDLGKESDFHSQYKAHQEEKDPDSIKDQDELSFLEHYKDLDILKPLKKNKDKIIKILAVISSVVLILVGIILISNSVMRISDNVIFGERAMFSAFLILIGFLVLAVVFAGKFLQGTFLKKIQNELKITEGKTRETKNDPLTGTDKGMNKKD